MQPSKARYRCRVLQGCTTWQTSTRDDVQRAFDFSRGLRPPALILNLQAQKKCSFYTLQLLLLNLCSDGAMHVVKPCRFHA